MLTLGRPAAHASVLQRSASLRVLRVYAIAAAAAAVPFLALSGPLRASAVLPLVLAPALSHGHLVAVRRARAGAEAERRVAAAIRRSRPAAVVHGLRFSGRGDVDHLVLGRAAVAVETKSGSGQVRVGVDGSVTVSGRTLPGRPASQAVSSADAVAARAGVTVHAVLVVVGMRGRPFRSGRLTVCSARDLPALLRGFEGGLSSSSAAALARRLWSEHAG